MKRLVIRSHPTFAWLHERNFTAHGTICPHGCGVNEIDTHLFFQYQVARAIWFASKWNTRWEGFNFGDIFDFLIFVVPHNVFYLVHLDDQNDFLLFASLILNH